jgi:translation initiation factor 4G
MSWTDTPDDLRRLGARLRRGGTIRPNAARPPLPPYNQRPITETEPEPTPPLAIQLPTMETEPSPPSPHLVLLRSAAPIQDLKTIQYPEGIQSADPTLNPFAATSKFKYDEEFLKQFQFICIWKVSVDWDQKIWEIIGETNPGRSHTAPRRGETPSGQMGTMSSFDNGVYPRQMTSMQRFSFPGSDDSIGSSPYGSVAFPRPANSFSAFSPVPPNDDSIGSLPYGSDELPRPTNIFNPFSLVSLNSDNDDIIGSSPYSSDEFPQSDRLPLSGPMGVSVFSFGSSEPDEDSDENPDEDKWYSPLQVDENWVSPEIVRRKVDVSLSTMTTENFEKIADELLEISTQSKRETCALTLRTVTRQTSEKAINESVECSSLCAKICKSIMQRVDPSIRDESLPSVITSGNLVRRYLLDKCQRSFEHGWKITRTRDPQNRRYEETKISDENSAPVAYRRYLGVIRFQSELFMVGMLTERIMYSCIKKLLEFDDVPEDVAVVGLAILLGIVGMRLDASQKGKPIMDSYFTQIGSLINNKDLNSRMKSILMV